MSDSADYLPPVLQPAVTRTALKRVRAHWLRHFVRQNPPGNPAYALVWAVLVRIRTEGYVLRPYYALTLAQAAPGLRGAERFVCIRYAIRRLMDVVFSFDYPDGDGFFVLHLLHGSGPRPSGHTATRAYLAFNPQLAQYLLNVAHLDDLPVPTT